MVRRAFEMVRRIDGAIRRYQTRIIEIGASAGYGPCQMTISHDFERLRAFIRISSSQIENPVFFRSPVELNSDNSFWICMENQGSCVATVAIKYHEVEDLADAYMRHLFSYPSQITGAEKPLVGVNDLIPHLRGRVVYSGVAYVDSRFRNRKIASTLVRLGNLMSIPRFKPEWFIGEMFEKLYRSELWRDYGYTYSVPLFKIDDPNIKDENMLYLVWSESSKYIENLENTRNHEDISC